MGLAHDILREILAQTLLLPVSPLQKIFLCLFVFLLPCFLCSLLFTCKCPNPIWTNYVSTVINRQPTIFKLISIHPGLQEI